MAEPNWGGKRERAGRKATHLRIAVPLRPLTLIRRDAGGRVVDVLDVEPMSPGELYPAILLRLVTADGGTVELCNVPEPHAK